MINSRKTSDLHPYVAKLCNKLIEQCKNEGIIIQVTSTLRDAEYQRYLFEKVSGSTNTPLVGAHGKSLGLEWGGDWKSKIKKYYIVRLLQ